MVRGQFADFFVCFQYIYTLGMCQCPFPSTEIHASFDKRGCKLGFIIKAVSVIWPVVYLVGLLRKFHSSTRCKWLIWQEIIKYFCDIPVIGLFLDSHYCKKVFNINNSMKPPNYLTHQLQSTQIPPRSPMWLYFSESSKTTTPKLMYCLKIFLV